MPENLKQSFNPNYSSELNIESIISAPLVAASKANVVMVTGQTRFLLDYCFNKKGETYEPVMIEMVMSKGVVDPSKEPEDPDYIKKAEMTFSIPLLCLVPINSIAIDNVNVDFDMEITSVTSYDTETEKGVINKKAQLNGKITNKQDGGNDGGKSQYKSQSTSKLSVNIHAGPLPLPVGVLTILDLYTKAIQPLPKKGDTIETKQE